MDISILKHDKLTLSNDWTLNCGYKQRLAAMFQLPTCKPENSCTPCLCRDFWGSILTLFFCLAYFLWTLKLNLSGVRSTHTSGAFECIQAEFQVNSGYLRVKIKTLMDSVDVHVKFVNVKSTKVQDSWNCSINCRYWQTEGKCWKPCWKNAALRLFQSMSHISWFCSSHLHTS